MSFTYKDIPTQDRLCPTGKHDKTRGGCACVQVGGDPGLPTDFQVTPGVNGAIPDFFLGGLCVCVFFIYKRLLLMADC